LIATPDSRELAGLQVPSTMTEADWAQMLAIINAYKPSIVKAGSRLEETGREGERD